jgi:hypothetical protein
MFDAARDLVFTNSADGNTIMSGGYRISKMFGGAKKKQRGGGKYKNKNKNHNNDNKEEEEYHEAMENFYKEESGIPMGLLFFSPKFRVEHEQVHAHVQQQQQQQQQHAQKKESEFHTNDNDNNIAGIGELELIMPQSSQSSHFMIVGDDNNCGFKEDARELESEEVDADLFQILLENALTHKNADNNHSSNKMTKKRTANFSNLKNLKVDKVYMRSKTRRHKK